MRTIVTILAPIAVISPAIYLFATPTSQLLFHRQASVSAPVRAGNPVPVIMVVFDELSGTSLVDGGGRIDAALLSELRRVGQRVRRGSAMPAAWRRPRRLPCRAS